MYSEKYIAILEERLVRELEKVQTNDNVIFQQKSAPCNVFKTCEVLQEQKNYQF